MKKFKSIIKGDLDIFVGRNEDTFDGKIEKWDEILIHGNPEGLRSFARLLIQLADHDQERDNDLPEGTREHEHLRPGLELANSSDTVVVGRLDAKGTGDYYERYILKDFKKLKR